MRTRPIPRQRRTSTKISVTDQVGPTNSPERSGDQKPLEDHITAGPRTFITRELRKRVGNQDAYGERFCLGGLSVVGTRVDPDAVIEFSCDLEAIAGGISVIGRITAPFVGECRRCLEPMVGTLSLDVRETFVDRPQEGETYPIEEDSLDFEPLVREAILLSLPLTPLCSDDCVGPVPDVFPVVVLHEGAEPPTDPRWAALDSLRLPTDELGFADEAADSALDPDSL